MSLSSWISSTFSRSLGRRAKRRHPATTSLQRRHSFRPRLEALENRLTPSLSTLVSFGFTNGEFVKGGLLMDSSGNLYGTAEEGGASNDGTIFELAKGSGTLTTLASFNGADGADPIAGLIMDSSGNLYGTAYEGGPTWNPTGYLYGDGTVFELAKGSGTITTLASFNGTNGADPWAGLIMDSSGDLYGTTYYGGASNYGTVFELAKGSGTITTLASFNGTNGANPFGALIMDSNGNLYGTAGAGGAYNYGTVFELAKGSGTITMLASFNVTDGEGPIGGLIMDSSGNLYGTTELGGAGDGTAFELAKGSSTITTLASFNGTDGSDPWAGLVMDSSGNLYGTTAGGGASSDGTVFELAKGSGTVTTLAAFTGTNGSSPEAGLIMDSSGNLYSTTFEGGASGSVGSVFELAKGSGTVTTLASFVSNKGSGPKAGLLMDSSGNLYGITSSTVFELTHGSGTVTTLASSPGSGLIMDGSGNLYGTTEAGGNYGYGSIFEIVKSTGALTRLASFNSTNGANPYGALIMDASGNLYGTTSAGGASKNGTVFELTKGSSTLTTLASFNGANGSDPRAALIMDSSGNLFGTTESGGASIFGTVFELAKGSGTITTLASFNSATSGFYPLCALIMDGSGNLYGTTYEGGASNRGTVFELVQGSGAITTLASFNSSDGAYPEAGLIMDSSGNLYGTTESGGPFVYGLYGYGDGTVFELVKGSGTITTLTSFNGSDGVSPYDSLIMDSSGNLYGTTAGGGAGDSGTVFEWQLAGANDFLVSGFPSPTTAGVAQTFTVTVQNGNGTTDTAYTGTVHFTSSDPQAVLPANYTFTAADAGVHTFSGTLGTVATQSIAVTDTVTSSIYGAQTGIAVAPAAANHLTVALGTTAQAGVASNVTVTALDPYGNIATGYTGTVQFTSTDPQAVLPANYTFTAGDAGVHTFSATLRTPGTQTISATDTVTASINGTQTGIIVTPAAPLFSALASFGFPNGACPEAGLIMDSSGNLYGTTVNGSTLNDGTVFEIAKGSGTITTLASFNGSDGANPYGALIMDSSGNLYGTTANGGAANDGAVFELAKGSGTITTLVSFNGSDGANPYGALIMDSSGNLYGTTASEVASNYTGTVFELAQGSGTITTLASFTDSFNPGAGLIMDSSGNLYGTTTPGVVGPSEGTVFELAQGSGTITFLAAFNGTNGEYPSGTLIMDSSGNLYGTAAEGGAASDGTVFELARGSSTITTLASFNGTNGANPTGALIMDSSGNLYSTAEVGGASGDGTVFELAKGSGTITTLASFNGTNGEYPEAALIMDGSGNVYGTTYSGGSDYGTVFELAKGGSTITTLASFGAPNGLNPIAGLIMDSSGNLYGTTSAGGAFSDGTVFEVVKGSGTVTTLASFNGTDGSDPWASLIMDSSGNLYGTTYYGGTANDGTVFELAHGSGTITALASFNGTNGAYVNAPLIVDSSGNLYGTGSEGGPTWDASGGVYGDGTVFEVVKGSGTITTLASFTGTNGADPQGAALIMDSSGNLYGTTSSTVFELVKGSGTITTLASFTGGGNGANPHGALLMDSSGNLYGTADAASAALDSTVFELAKGSSTITTLASFNGTNGAYPNGSLIMDSSGNLYGTTSEGGPTWNPSYDGVYGDGTVFELVKGSGTITSLVLFNGANGEYPEGGLIMDSSSNLYTTTNGGGALGEGTVFELQLPISFSQATLPAATVGASYSQSLTAVGGKAPYTFAVTAGSLPAGLSLSAAGVLSGKATVAGPSTFTVTATDANSKTGSNTYAFTVNPTQDIFVVTGFPSATTAGVAGTFTVKAEDGNGNVLTNYTGTVHFTSSDAQAGLPASYTFTAADAGVHTFTATLKTAGAQSITVTDPTASAFTGTDSGITVTPAAASSLTIGGFPSPTTAGSAGNVTVTALDAYGNIATGYTGTVHFTSSDAKAVLPANYKFTAANAGTYIFAITLKTAGTQSITAADTVTSNITGTQTGITVNPAAASVLVITGPTTATAGTAFSITVTVYDAYGNVATGYTGTVKFKSTDTTATLPANYTFTAADAGTHTFSGLVLKRKGKQSITATDTLTSAITGSLSVTVS